MFTTKTLVPLCLAISALSACGGGGGGVLSTNNTLALSDAADAPSDLLVFLSSVQSGTVESSSGTYNRDDDSFDVTTLSGAYDPSTDTISLDGGGTGSVDYLADYSGAVLIERGSGTEYGVFGIPASNIPSSGFATYNGSSAVVIVESSGIYELEGTSQVEARFANRTVDVAIDDLMGSMTDGTGATVAGLTDVARLEINDAAVTDGSFEGGNFDFKSTMIGSVESGQEDVNHAGALFGPAADEVGGTFVVDDTDVGTLLIHGVYTAD